MSTMNAYAIVEVLNAHNGQPAVYASMARTGGLPFEFFYENGHWTKTSIGDEPGINQIHCGIGRNDGIHRIYSAENFDILAEFTRFGASWSKSSETKTDENKALTTVAVGPGRGGWH